MARRPVGRVIRVAESPARGTMVLQGVCTCGWRSARLVIAHFRAEHPDLK
jgi:hypothetical protein